MAARERRLNRIGVAAVLSVVIGSLAYAAVNAEGFKASEVKLHEGGIWMTRGAVIGRYNHQLGKVDTQSATFGDDSVDVQQFDSTVLVVTANPPALSRYDVAQNSVIGTAQALPADAIVSLGGTNGALLDPTTSRLWFTTGDALPSVKTDVDDGSVHVDGATSVVVGTDGTAHVFASGTGTLWTLPDIFTNVSTTSPGTPTGSTTTTVATDAADSSGASEADVDGPDVAVERAARVLPGAAGSKQVSAAGGQAVMLDTDTSTLTVAGDSFVVDGVDADSKLQQPSADEHRVIIATSQSLLSVDIGSHAVTVLGGDTSGDGSPLQPVWLDGCAFGAWQTRAVRYCDDARLNEVSDKTPSPQTPRRFRVNHDLVVLNYVSGAWLDMSADGKLSFNDDWSSALQPDDEQQDQPQTTPDDESDVNTCSFDPAAPNQPPTAVDDTFGARTDVPTILDVLSGVASDGKPDADADCDVLTISLEQSLADGNGALPNGAGTIKVIDSGRRLQYEPPGADQPPPASFSFGYLLSDGVNPAVSATVRVGIVAADANQTPEPHGDATSVAQGKSVEINALANDFDPDGDALVVTDAQILDIGGNPAGVNGPDGDSLVWQANGRLSYRAPANVTKKETIRYTVSDGRSSADGEVQIAVIPGGSGQNKAPNTLNDAVVGVEGQNLAIDVLANDSDPNNDVLRLVTVDPIGTASPPKWSANTGGVVALDSATVGEHSYAYEITDGAGGSAWGRLRISVLPAGQNHAPVGVRDDTVVVQGKASLADVLANDTDIDGDVLMITEVQGMVSVDGVSAADAVSVEVLEHRVLRITPKSAAEAGKVYRFAYRVSDGQEDDSAVVAVRVAPPSPGQSPVAGSDEASVHLGGTVGIPVLVNDYDPDADPISIVPSSVRITSTPAVGQLFAEGDRVVYVAPSPDEQAATSTVFGVYSITDGQHVVEAQVKIGVRDLAENAPPSPADVLVRAFAGDRVTIPLPRYGLDPDGDPVEVISQSLPITTRGQVTFDKETQSFVYDAPAATGQDSFSFDLRDAPARGDGAVGKLTVRISVAEPVGNSPPVAVDDTFEVLPDQVTSIPVLANDTDPDGDTILLAPQAGVDQPRSGAGSTAVNADGQRIDFTATGAVGTSADFQYRIVDDRGSAPVIGTVHVDVVATVTNKPPVARDDLRPAAKTGDVLTIDVLRNDRDPENDPLSVQCGAESTTYCAPMEVTVDGVTRQALEVTMGTTSLSFTYIVSDASHQTVETGAARAAVQIPLVREQQNRPPTCQSLRVDVPADAADPFTVPIDVVTQCSDPDGDAVAIWRDAKPAVASGTAITDAQLVWDQGDSFTFHRDPEVSGEVLVRYQVQDAKQGAGTGDVLLVIVGKTNTPPTVKPLTQRLEAGASPVTIDLATAVTDPDPGDLDAMRFGGVSGSDAGGVTADLSGSVLTLQAPRTDLVVDGEAPKTFTIDYTATDPDGEPVPGTVAVTVLPSNKPGPTARDDRMDDVKQGGTGSVNVLVNDLPGDASDPVLSQLVVTTTDGAATGANGQAGTVHIDGSGNAVFTPTPGFHGAATFSYTVQDGRHTPAKQATANVSVNVLDKPDRPAQPSVGDQQSGVATVTFAPTPDNGSPITSYAVTWPGGSKDCGIAAGQCVVSGLTNGTEYVFQVTATNAVGTSEPSVASQPYTPDQVPDQPPQPTADWGDKSATVTWGGITNPGSPLTAVRIDVSPSDVGSATLPGSASGTYTFTGLKNGTPYTFTLTAVNSAKPNGQSAPSTPSLAVTPAGAPGNVAAPTLAEGDGLVTAAWSPANANGDPAGLTYTVKLMNGTTVERTVGPLTSTSTTVQATNGQKYRVVVEINNKFTLRSGSPVVTPSSNEITPSGKPKAPASLTSTANLPGAARLVIGATNNNGAPIDSYTVTASNGGGTQTFAGSDSGATVDFGGLANGQTYTFTVVAHNKNGNGDSTTSSNSAVPYGPPVAPTLDCRVSGSSVICSYSQNSLNGPGPGASGMSMLGRTVASGPSGMFSADDRAYNSTVPVVASTCNTGTNGPASNCSQTSVVVQLGPPPTPVVSCSASGITMNCSWSVSGDFGADPHDTYVSVDGAAYAQADSGSFSRSYGYAESHSMTVRTCNHANSYCSADVTRTVTTDTPPRRVWTTRGGAWGPCTTNPAATCYFFTVHITGFPPGTYGITCFPGEAVQRSGGSINSGGYTGEYTASANPCVAGDGANATVDVGGTRGSGSGYW